MFQYLRFLLKSSNQHGVHSPFVYNYITKGIYNGKQNNKHLNRTNQWLIKSVNYFQPANCYFFDNHTASQINVKSTTLHSATLLVHSYHKNNVASIKTTIQNMNNNQLLFLCLYSYPESFINELRLFKDITLVVDFYYGCLISKRIEQPKQNFYIRF